MNTLKAFGVCPKRAGFVIFCFWLGFYACGERDTLKEVDLSQRETLPDIMADQPPLKVAIAGMISPQKTFIYYKALVSYLASQLDLTYLIVQGSTYAEVNNLIQNKEVDLAFVCSGAYVQGRTDFGLEALAAPQVNGQAVYYSYIIVNKDSPVENFPQLKGSSFAFTDPNSNTGYLVPMNILAQMNETVDSFFKDTIFTYNHDKSIINVARGFMDGAAVDSLIWEFMQLTQSKYTAQTKVIQKVGPYGMPPVAVHPELNQTLKQGIQVILLAMHNDPKGKTILKQLNIEQFVSIRDEAYDSIRKIAIK